MLLKKSKMATLTLEQLQGKHPSLKTTKSLAEIRGQQPLTTEGNQFADTGKANKFQSEQGRKNVGFFSKLIGGGKLAEGLGQAIAAPSVQRGLTQEQRQTEELQQKLLARIREKEAAGEDATRLQNALKQSQGLATFLQDAQTDFGESLVSNKEVVGSSVRLGATLGGGLLGRTLAKAMALGKATNLASGVVRGAGVGASTGAIEGAVQGAGLAAEENATAGGIALGGAVGAGSGAVLGGAIGAVGGGIGGVVRGRQQSAKQFVEDLVSPPQTKKMREEALLAGRLDDPTFFEEATLRPSNRDQALARSVADVVSPKAGPGTNMEAVAMKVSNTNRAVRDFIATNKAPVNKNQIRAQIMQGKDKLRLVFASDATAERTYDAVADAFMAEIRGGDTLGVFGARQTFDKIPAIRKLLQTSPLGESARKEIVHTVRGEANRFIADLLPKGNPYRKAMLEEHLMMETYRNMAAKFQNIVGKNKLQLLTAKYPILKWVVGGLAAGAIGAAGVGVGSTIIGSSE